MNVTQVAELHRQVVRGRSNFPAQSVLVLFHAAANPADQVTAQWVTGKMLCAFTTAQRYIWLLESGGWLYRGRLTPRCCDLIGLVEYQCEV